MNPAGNYYDKFQAKNPAARYLMRGFKQAIIELLAGISYESVLEVGCGEGYILDLVHPPRALGLDVDHGILQEARRRYPHADYGMADGAALPLATNSVDLLLAIEVMEHVQHPIIFVQEARRVAHRYCLFSVPREPIWRVLNLARGSYLRDWGNTPGHINHWNAKAFVKLLGDHMQVVQVRQPLPWTVVLCQL